MDDRIKDFMEKYNQSGISSEGLSSKVYSDEPILITAAQMKSYVPPIFREMRAVSRKESFMSSERLFYLQGKLMEEFEDDFEYHGSFSRYFPTYQAMTDLQLRAYFSWRTKIRAGIYQKTFLSFAFVYIYELLNLIGVKSPSEGYQALRDFWEIYREIDIRVDHYLKVWVKDFVIYYELELSLLADVVTSGADSELLILQNYKQHTSDEIFDALLKHSAYRLENSKFYKEHSEDVKKVCCGVYERLYIHYDKNCKGSIYEKYLGRVTNQYYNMFASAVFYKQDKHRAAVYKINDAYKYICTNGVWSCERLFWMGSKSKEIGILLKSIDYQMRIKYSYKFLLQEVKGTKLLLQFIIQEIEKLSAEKNAEEKKNAVREVKIDRSKLSSIRSTALEIQSKLIVEEEQGTAEEIKEISAEIQKISAEIKDTPSALQTDGPRITEAEAESGIDLEKTEREFLSCLISGRPYDLMLRENGIMLSVLTDGINEKLYEEFGDTVMEYDGDRPVIIEDYLEELKGIVEE